jgi:beta-galactosidase
LDRREFIWGTSTLVASAALQGKAANSGAEEHAIAGRSVLAMNRNWRFKPEKIEGAQAPDFDDSHFERIVIPHTNIAFPWHGFDDKDYEFISTYRRRFKLPRDAAGKRVFVDFEGAMTASTVWINGVLLGEYKGGFTPFSFELTVHLRQQGENVLVVQLDSTERSDIPPFGYEIDYLTFGGIYREVALRIVPTTYIDNIFARPRNVLTSNPSIDVNCFLGGDVSSDGHLSLAVELRDGDRMIAKGTHPVERPPDIARKTTLDPQASDPYNTAPVHSGIESINDPARYTVSLSELGELRRWDIDQPHLYTVHVQLMLDGKIVDVDTRRVGFREAVFTDRGFSINGRIVKLRGLDRHQTFPFVGQAMPARAQRKDAQILRSGLHCNIVRTSHYPQSRHFLDCCDEIGLLVLEEIPGWQHIGDEEWKKVAIDNVGRMIRRDWNHPSVVLWGVRINESKDDHDFYTRTNALARALDDSRQTGGIRTFQESEFLEDVFTLNDF